jgi:hypothetical protein
LSDFESSHFLSQQRLMPIGELWESLDANTVKPTRAQKEELDRRLATLDEELAQRQKLRKSLGSSNREKKDGNERI